MAELVSLFSSDTVFRRISTSSRRLGSGSEPLAARSDPERLRSRLPFFHDLDPTNPDAWVHFKRDNLEAFVDRGGAVKVAFFGSLDTLNRVEDPRRAAGSRVRVASLVDLAGMKMRVIQVRGSWKDYVDIHTLVSQGIDVPTGLAAARSAADVETIERFVPPEEFRNVLQSAPAGVFTEEIWRRWHERFGMPVPPLPRRRFPDGSLGPEAGRFFGR